MIRKRVVTVKYLNTKPFINGIQRYFSADEVELILDSPAGCAEQLISGRADIGLIPVAVFPDLDSYRIFSDYCIGCDGPVGTVKIYSRKPLTECKYLYLDYQSRTSVFLSKLILKDYLSLNLSFLDGFPGYEQSIRDDYAGLIIGDRCFSYNQEIPFQLDLGLAWKQWTGLPFVFAVWVCRLETELTFLNRFNYALQSGIQSIAQDFGRPDEIHYLTKNLSFDLGHDKQTAMTQFLEQTSRFQPV